jgi:hypothetical protein
MKVEIVSESVGVGANGANVRIVWEYSLTHLRKKFMEKELMS